MTAGAATGRGACPCPPRWPPPPEGRGGGHVREEGAAAEPHLGPDGPASSSRPPWDPDTILSSFIHRALSPSHRLPEKHFLSQSRAPLLSG